MQGHVRAVQRSEQPRDPQRVQQQAEVQRLLWKDYQTFWQLPARHHSPEFLASLRDRWQQIRTGPRAKTSADTVEIIPGGVRGDSHWYEPWQTRSGLWKRRYNEVNTITWEEIQRLNRLFGCDHPPGHLGENITVEGLDLDLLPVGTVLGIGGARLRVGGARSFCWKFVAAFCTSELVTAEEFKRFDLTRTGRALQWVESGWVRAGDPVTVITLGTGASYTSSRTRPPSFELWPHWSAAAPVRAVE